MMRLIILFVFLSGCASVPSLHSQLKGSGVRLEIHAAPQDTRHWVGTLRDPKDFFKFEFVSLLSSDAAVEEQFKHLHRHDVVRVWGHVIVPSPQKHIDVSRLVVEKPYAVALPAYERQSKFPANFPEAGVPFLALVHAVDREHHLLVVEYQDVVLPVRLPASLAIPDLYRNDIVELTATIASHPDYPKHLKAASLRLKDRIVEMHGLEIERRGVLVKFPQSPQVLFDVFAVKEDLPGGMSRQYTIVNFENVELFKSLREKLAKLWNAADPSKIVNGRNKLLNPDVVVRIRGKANVVDRGQANPQIIVDKLEDVSLVGDTAHPRAWWQYVNPVGAPDWEIFPQTAREGEVLLSKRGELGIFSNFAATPFMLDGKKYASIEGFWQMMKFPDPKLAHDPRAAAQIAWTKTREQVAQLVSFAAKSAGDEGEKIMQSLGIDWVSYRGKKMLYQDPSRGAHYALIRRAMKAKLDQTPGLKALLLKTIPLKLAPDHHQGENPPPAWKYYEIWMELRSQLKKNMPQE